MYNRLYKNRRDQVWNVLSVLGDTGATMLELFEDVRLDGIRKQSIRNCVDFLITKGIVVVDGTRDVVTLLNEVYRNRPIYKAVPDMVYRPVAEGTRDRVNDMSPWVTIGWEINRRGIPVLTQQKGDKTRMIPMVYNTEESRKVVSKAIKRSGVILSVESPIEQPEFNIGTQLDFYKSDITTASVEKVTFPIQEVGIVVKPDSAYSQLAG